MQQHIVRNAIEKSICIRWEGGGGCSTSVRRLLEETLLRDGQEDEEFPDIQKDFVIKRTQIFIYAEIEKT